MKTICQWEDSSQEDAPQESSAVQVSAATPIRTLLGLALKSLSSVSHLNFPKWRRDILDRLKHEQEEGIIIKSYGSFQVATQDGMIKNIPFDITWIDDHITNDTINPAWFFLSKNFKYLLKVLIDYCQDHLYEIGLSLSHLQTMYIVHLVYLSARSSESKWKHRHLA